MWLFVASPSRGLEDLPNLFDRRCGDNQDHLLDCTQARIRTFQVYPMRFLSQSHTGFALPFPLEFFVWPQERKMIHHRPWPPLLASPRWVMSRHDSESQ